nr:ERAD-associated E3 ubiquitin-protein ligase component HRD3A [Tanacetum cinerariifolium]
HVLLDNEQLYILIEADLPPIIVDLRLRPTHEIIEELFKPMDEFKENIKQRKLRELAMLNSNFREESPAPSILPRGITKNARGLCTDSERHQRAHSLWWKASEQGNKHAALLIGDAYYYGRLNDQAMFNLGYMHGHGQGLPLDIHLAKRYYDQALETDSAAKLSVMLSLSILWLLTLVSQKISTTNKQNIACMRSHLLLAQSQLQGEFTCLYSIWELRSQHEEECRHLKEQLRLKTDTVWVQGRALGYPPVIQGLSCCSNLQNMVAARIKDLFQALDTARYVGSDETLILTEAYDHHIYRYFDGGDSLHSAKDDECIGSEDDEIMKIMLMLDMMVS